ncbi:hypothetical protein D1871_04690 [Nakamurella silvestris]|nr:hypothetical protein D1871_04690 [Nakamurella silvestris]
MGEIVDPDLKPDEQHPAVYWKVTDKDRARPLPGLFWLTANGLPMIQLHEPLDPGEAGMFASHDAPSLLHGLIMGNTLTLTDLELVISRQSMRSAGPVLVRYSARMALVGDYWLGDEEADRVFDQVKVRYWDQDRWTETQSVGLQNPTEETPVSIHHLRPAPIPLACTGGRLEVRDASSWNPTAIHPSSNFHIELDEPTTLPQLIEDWLLPLQFLLVSATSRYSDVEYMAVRNTNLVFPDKPHNSQVSWLRVYTSQRKRPAKDLLSGTMLHRLSDFPDGYDFDRVFDVVRTNRFAVGQYSAVKSDQTGGHLTTFVASAQAVEALDRVAHPDAPVGDEGEWSKKVKAALREIDAPKRIVSSASYGAKKSYRPSLEARLNRVDADTGKVVGGIYKSKSWAADLAAARNVVAHGLENTELLKTDVRGVQAATETYLLLFELRLLTLIGFTAEQADSLSSRRGYYWTTVQQLKDGAAHIQALASRSESTAQSLQVSKPRDDPSSNASSIEPGGSSPSA